MKKIVALICIFSAILLLFAGCRSNRGSDISSSGAASTVSEIPSETLINDPDIEPVDDAVANTSSKQLDIEKINSLDSTRQDFWFGKIADNGYPQIYSDGMRTLIEQYDGLVFGDTEKQEILLTFDCGYEYENLTLSILDTLKEKGVHAVFFVTMDYVKDNAEIVKRMIEEGHTVGNHSTKHPNFSECSTDRIQEEIVTLHDYVKEQFGYEMKYFRFPEGCFNEKSLEIVNQLGYKSVFWSFAYSDWDTSKQMGETEALEKLQNGLHKGEILLLHAVSSTNNSILGSFIDSSRNSGYEFIELT